MSKQARRIVVHGMVQGVGFRYFVRRVADRLELTGDVRNLPDNTVEIVAEGTPRKLDDLISEVRNGPPSAVVDRLEIHDIQVSGRYRTFLIEGW